MIRVILEIMWDIYKGLSVVVFTLILFFLALGVIINYLPNTWRHP